jgi:amino acid transporter
VTTTSIDRRTMSTSRIFLFSTNAFGPLIILLGGIPTTFAAGGVSGVPLAFVLVTAVLWLLSVGYTAMARRVPHPAVYYAAVSRGLGKPLGVAAGALGLAAYNAIVTCMYGLVGAWTAGLFGGTWWVYALLVWGVVAVLGVRRVIVSAWLLGIVLVFSALFIGLFVVAGLANPAEGHVTFYGYSWAALSGPTVGSVLTMCTAGVMGFDGGASFGTEAVHGGGPGRAVTLALWTGGIGSSVMALAMGVGNGWDQVVAVAQDPEQGMPLNTMTDTYGFLGTTLTQLMLIFAVVATILSVQAIAARYGFAMAQERVLPRWVTFTGRGEMAGSPVGGSLLQSAIGLLVILAFAISGKDPLHTLFPWFATAGALGLVALLLASSMAAMIYLRGTDEPAWVRWIAPALGLVLGGVMFGAMLLHSDVLLGAGPGSRLPVVIPAVLALIAIGGLLWGCYLAARRRDIYAGISEGTPQPLEHVARPFTAMPI